MAAPQEPRPDKSVTKDVGVGDLRRFSSFDDLAGWAVRRGLASDVADVRANRHDLWGDLLFSWYTQGQVACVFATNLARRTETARWYSAVVQGTVSADLVTTLVDTAATSGAEALQLLFPGDGSAAQALALTRTLAQHSRWACTENEWMEGESGDSLQVGLRWVSPRREYESWALGIAPFEPMPFTRRLIGAPFVALVLRPTAPVVARAPIPTGTSGLPVAHLAHMDDLLGADQPRREKWTAGTKRAKRALISPDPMSRARARVTFALPTWGRKELAGVLT